MAMNPGLAYRLKKHDEYWKSIAMYTLLGVFVGSALAMLVAGLLKLFLHQEVTLVSWYLVFAVALATSWVAYGEGVNRGVKLAEEINEENAEYREWLEKQRRTDEKLEGEK